MPGNYSYFDEDFCETPAVPNTKYIYVLITNHSDEVAGVPYYVGVTHKPKTRFKYHRMTEWHWGTFRRPVTVRILLMTTQAEVAEQDLIRRFTLAGHPLTNSYITDPDIASLQSEWGLFELPHDALLTRLAGMEDGEDTLNEWLEHWGSQSEGGRAVVAADTSDASATLDEPTDTLFRTAAGTDIRQHPSYATAPADITAGDLCQFVSLLNYDIYKPAGQLAPKSKLLLITIAAHYNPDLGYAELSYAKLAAVLGGTAHSIAKLMPRIINSTGLWTCIPGNGVTRSGRYFPLFVDGVPALYLSMVKEMQGKKSQTSQLALAA